MHAGPRYYAGQQTAVRGGNGNERPARDGRTRGHITGKTSSATPSASLARDERDGFNVSERAQAAMEINNGDAAAE